MTKKGLAFLSFGVGVATAATVAILPPIGGAAFVIVAVVGLYFLAEHARVFG